MACSLPCVATDVAASAKLSDGCLLVQPESPPMSPMPCGVAANARCPGIVVTRWVRVAQRYTIDKVIWHSEILASAAGIKFFVAQDR